jgi:hypothetical protein
MQEESGELVQNVVSIRICITDMSANFFVTNFWFYLYTVHSEENVVHSPTNALFIKLGKV